MFEQSNGRTYDSLCSCICRGESLSTWHPIGTTHLAHSSAQARSRTTTFNASFTLREQKHASISHPQHLYGQVTGPTEQRDDSMMDAFLSKLSYHATSYAIRSCLALTSTYVARHASTLLKAVDEGPLRKQFYQLQRRVARKIELISPVLESIEVRHAQGETSLGAIIKISRELREDIDALESSILVAIPNHTHDTTKQDVDANPDRVQLMGIIEDMKELITNIDDSIPLVNLWISTLGAVQPQEPSFSPSRLLQASMLLNVADTQYIISPAEPMQVGPNFYVSLYMLFRGHAAIEPGEEPYGIEAGQRKPLWQQVMRKARARLYRVPVLDMEREYHGSISTPVAYKYEIQVIEDLDDGLFHTPEEGQPPPSSVEGINCAGIREKIPVAEVSKLLYTEVGNILNICPDDEERGNPVLLIKRDMQTPPASPSSDSLVTDGNKCPSQPTPDEDDQGEIDKQLFEELSLSTNASSSTLQPVLTDVASSTNVSTRRLPANLDPQWLALEVFVEDTHDDSSFDNNQRDMGTDDGDSESDSPQKLTASNHSRKESSSSSQRLAESELLVDANLRNQFARMGSRSNRRPALSENRQIQQQHDSHNTEASESEHDLANTTPNSPQNQRLLKRSPFGAIRTSLSLLEMLLRLTSLQEFEQKTHLSIPDHVLKFYLGDSASTSGLRGQERWAAKVEAEAKMGFDPYSDAPVGIGGSTTGVGIGMRSG